MLSLPVIDPAFTQDMNPTDLERFQNRVVGIRFLQFVLCLESFDLASMWEDGDAHFWEKHAV